jgi:uncharacterized protein (TIGR01777 family)
MRVFVTGGTGLVGSRLIPRLLGRGDDLVLLTRRPEAARPWGERCLVLAGDPTQAGDWMKKIAECDAVVHLAGQGLFSRRWSAEFKDLLRCSRVEGTTNVARALAEHPRRADGSPRILANASAIGYYGPHGDEELDETAPRGDDFLARLCADWENATRPAADAGARVALIRTGIVFDSEGGALAQMLPPFRRFVGGPVGSGRQWMSWIHHEDVTGLILFVLDVAQVQGPINTTAPQPVTNRDFSHTLGRALRRPSFMPMPAFALRLLIGEAAEVISTGQRVLPRKALELGYKFRFPDLEGALRNLLNRPPPEADESPTR